MALATLSPLIPLARRRFSVEEYARLASLGLFDGENLELLFGEIITNEMPQRPAHRLSVSLILPIALDWSGPDHHALCQLPLQLGSSVPEPDICIVPGQPRDYSDAHPTTATLIIEVSDTTLETDRTTKAMLYADAGIEEYWILNLVERTLEVRRQPGASGYRSLQTFGEQDSVAPLIAPDRSALVSDLLP
jgi:Uma2 family endonuclease